MAAAILVLLGTIVVLWSLSDFDDHVPLVIPAESLDQAESRSVRFVCGAPFGSPSVTPSDAAADREFELERSPCERTRNEHRQLAAMNLAVVFLGLLILGFVRGQKEPPRERDQTPGDERPEVTSSAPRS